LVQDTEVAKLFALTTQGDDNVVNLIASNLAGLISGELCPSED